MKKCTNDVAECSLHMQCIWWFLCTTERISVVGINLSTLRNSSKLIGVRQSTWLQFLSIVSEQYIVHAMSGSLSSLQSITGHKRLHMTTTWITEIQPCIWNTHTYNWILVVSVNVMMKGAGTQLSYQPWSKTYFHFVTTMTPLFNSSAGMFMQTVHKAIYVKITNHLPIKGCNKTHYKLTIFLISHIKE